MVDCHQIILFSVFTLLCGSAQTPTMFPSFRFLAGFGLGGIMPNIIALLTDYAPVLGIYLMPSFGWESVFWVAGLPLLLLPLIYKKLPETASYLIRTGKKEELFAILSKVSTDTTFNKDDEIMALPDATTKIPLIGLFQEKRTLSTIMFWIAFFSCLLMVYGLNTWLPKLTMEAGYALNSSLGFLIALQSGAIVGTLIIAKLCDKYGTKKMLVPMYASGAVALTLLGFGGNIYVIYGLVAIAGAATIGSQNIVQSYVSQYYPAYIRSTALGTASSIGRIGGMCGPLLGGFLLSISLPIQLNFIAFAIPGLIAAVALAFVPRQPASIQESEKKSESEHNETVQV